MLTSDNEGSTDEPASAARLAISRVFIYSTICFLLRRAPPERKSDMRGGRGEGKALLFHFSKERENLHAREVFFSFSFFLFHSSFYLRLFDCFVYDTGIKIRSVG